MATLAFNITVPDDKQAEIIEYFVKNQGYTDTIIVDGLPVANPETRNQAARRFVVEFIRKHYRGYKEAADTKAAAIAAASAADAVSIS